ncbi:MAG TPA: hypothetical protein VIM09_04010 [Chthoniobacterales bacterium]
MRINNWKHFPWFVFVCLATIAACILYVGNFHPARLPSWIQLPSSLIQARTEHHTVGGTPLGLWFGSISLGIFVFAALLSLRKKIPLWRVGTVQRWLRAHIWLTILTIPLVLLHSGFRFGGGMTTFLMLLYGIVMVSGFYGLFLQHLMPRLMKERLPAETVFEQIPHIRAQLAAAAEKLRDSFKPAPPKKPDAGAAVMASTKGELSTPVARAKSVTGSALTAAPVTAAATSAAAKAVEAESEPAPPSIPNAAVTPAAPKAETIGTPTARVQSDPPGAPVARTEVPAGDQPAPSPPVAPAEKPAPPPAPAAKPPAPAAAPKPAAPAVAKPATAAAPKPAAKPAAPSDPASEAVLIEFIERQILPYLQARRGDRMRLGNPRFSDDTFRFVKLRVTEGYRSRVEEIQGWCDERRMLDLQTRLQHWLHGWLFVHVPFSFFLLMLTIWHACVTLFYY